MFIASRYFHASEWLCELACNSESWASTYQVEPAPILRASSGAVDAWGPLILGCSKNFKNTDLAEEHPRWLSRIDNRIQVNRQCRPYQSFLSTRWTKEVARQTMVVERSQSISVMWIGSASVLWCYLVPICLFLVSFGKSPTVIADILNKRGNSFRILFINHDSRYQI